MRYEKYKSRRFLTGPGKRWKKFRLSNAFYPYSALTSKMSRVPARFFTIPDARENVVSAGSKSSMRYDWKVKLAKYLLRLVQSYYYTNGAGDSNADYSLAEAPNSLGFAVAPTLQRLGSLLSAPVVSPSAKNKVFEAFPSFDRTSFKASYPEDPFALSNFSSLPILKVYDAKLSELANQVSSYPDFSELRDSLYYGRLNRALAFKRTLNMLLADPYSIIGHLPYRLRRKMFVRKIAYVITRIKKVYSLHATAEKKRNFFYPALEDDEVVGKLRKFALKSDFKASTTISGFTQLINTHRWLDASVETLLELLLAQSRLQKFSKLGPAKRQLCGQVMKHIFATKVPSRQLSHLTEVVGGITSFLFSSKSSSAGGKPNSSSLAKLRRQVVREKNLFSFPSEQQFSEQKAAKFLLEKAKTIKTISEDLGKGAGQFNFFKPTLELKRRQRPLSRVLKPLAKRSKKKSYVSLLLRRFSNLLINYRILRIYYLGFRRIGGVVRPFYYFPCKFSVKVFLTFFGDVTKLKEISKIDTMYIKKPSLPFNLPRIRVKVKT